MRMSTDEFLARFPDHDVAWELRASTQASVNKSSSKGKAQNKASSSSVLEENFALQIRATKLPTPVREHRFHPERKWRMDFAWPELKIAVEIEGGVWGLGRHNRPKGFIADALKYNTAAEMGWTVLRFTGTHIRSGKAIEQLAKIMHSRTLLDHELDTDRFCRSPTSYREKT